MLSQKPEEQMELGSVTQHIYSYLCYGTDKDGQSKLGGTGATDTDVPSSQTASQAASQAASQTASQTASQAASRIADPVYDSRPDLYRDVPSHHHHQQPPSPDTDDYGKTRTAHTLVKCWANVKDVGPALNQSVVWDSGLWERRCSFIDCLFIGSDNGMACQPKLK